MKDVQQRYFRRARIVATILSLAPYVRAVALTGSVARGKATEKSDIDFWICLKTDRLWTGRIIVTAIVQLLGLRRYNDKIAGRICLNTYQTEESLEIHPKNLKNAKDYANIRILFAAGKTANDFFKANRWIKERGYHFKNRADSPSSAIATIIRAIFEVIYDILFGDSGERYLRSYQIKRILNDPRTKSAQRGQIFISDSELRFHPDK